MRLTWLSSYPTKSLSLVTFSLFVVVLLFRFGSYCPQISGQTLNEDYSLSPSPSLPPLFSFSFSENIYMIELTLTNVRIAQMTQLERGERLLNGLLNFILVVAGIYFARCHFRFCIPSK